MLAINFLSHIATLHEEHQLTSFGTNGFNLRDFRIEFLQKQKPILALGRLFRDSR